MNVAAARRASHVGDGCAAAAKDVSKISKSACMYFGFLLFVLGGGGLNQREWREDINHDVLV